MSLSENRRNPDTLLARRAVLGGLLAVGLGACGFQPALTPDQALGKLRNRVRVADPVDRNDFVLKAALEGQLGRGNDFDLTYRVTTTESNVGISPDQVITRLQIDGTAAFELIDTATNAVILKDSVTGFTSYGTTSTTASTAFARDAAFERLMVILADRIVTRLGLLTTVPA